MPSKKIIISLIICVSVLISISILKWGGNLQILNQNKSQNIVSDDNSNVNVNLKNWQAILYSVNSTTTDITQKDDQIYDDGTLTSQVAKNFFGQYLILKQNNGTVTTDEANQIAQNTVDQASNSDNNATKYTSSELNINPKTSPTVVQKYMNDLNASIKNRTPKNTEDEITIINRAVKSGNPNDLAGLDKIIAGEKQFIVDLLKMSVPYDAVDLHLAFLNSASEVLYNTEGMRVIFTDPVRSFSAASKYRNSVLKMKSAIQELDNYFYKSK